MRALDEARELRRHPGIEDLRAEMENRLGRVVDFSEVIDMLLGIYREVEG